MTDTHKTSHGRLFDQFSARASHSHGGSYFDAGFGQKTLSEAHGKLYDLFGVPRDSSAHGEHFDEFGWKAMPALHGQQFDTGFQAPTAHDDRGGHGTWFDEFRGGTQVRYMLDGADCEGVVIDCHPDHAVVRSHDGQTHEVGLSQFLAYRTPNEHQAAPSLPASDAEAPSAHSADARGGGDRTPVPTDMPSVISEAPQGQYTEPRSGIPAGLMDTFARLKSIADELDVEKDIDTTETAAQGQPSGKTVGHRANCPRGGSGPCGPDVDGHCTLCKAAVRDHEAVGKTGTGDLGIEVPDREHKQTDHHSSQNRPGRCPHCGGVLADLDRISDQGTPDRAHKCLGVSLDILKTSLEA